MIESIFVCDLKDNVKSNLKILLPRKLYERVARNHRPFKIKPRFNLGGFRRLIIFPLLLFFLTGLEPGIILSPFRPALVLADNTQPQVHDQVTSQQIPVMGLPFPGYLSNSFSYYHPGIDIAAGLGTPIHPVADGVVSEVHFDLLGYGHYVVINHNSAISSLYGHLDKVFVAVGQRMSTNEVIGTVGLTGYTTGPHTHLEIHQNGVAINPLPLLPTLPTTPEPQFLTPYSANTGTQPKIAQTLKPNF